MTDAERLDLIQHYGWTLAPTNRPEDGWWVQTQIGWTPRFPTVREAVDAALEMLAGYALGNKST